MAKTLARMDEKANFKGGKVIMTRKAKRMLAKFMALVMAVTVMSFTGGFSSMQSSVVYGAAAWNSETIYTGGDEVEYNELIYKCKYGGLRGTHLQMEVLGSWFRVNIREIQVIWEVLNREKQQS